MYDRTKQLEYFLKRLLNPEDLGWAVTQEVREIARDLLNTGDSNENNSTASV
jgi:hypothetical protein